MTAFLYRFKAYLLWSFFFFGGILSETVFGGWVFKRTPRGKNACKWPLKRFKLKCLTSCILSGLLASDIFVAKYKNIHTKAQAAKQNCLWGLNFITNCGIDTNTKFKPKRTAFCVLSGVASWDIFVDQLTIDTQQKNPYWEVKLGADFFFFRRPPESFQVWVLGTEVFGRSTHESHWH